MIHLVPHIVAIASSQAVPAHDAEDIKFIVHQIMDMFGWFWGAVAAIVAALITVIGAALGVFAPILINNGMEKRIQKRLEETTEGLNAELRKKMGAMVIEETNRVKHFAMALMTFNLACGWDSEGNPVPDLTHLPSLGDQIQMENNIKYNRIIISLFDSMKDCAMSGSAIIKYLLPLIEDRVKSVIERCPEPDRARRRFDEISEFIKNNEKHLDEASRSLLEDSLAEISKILQKRG